MKTPLAISRSQQDVLSEGYYVVDSTIEILDEESCMWFAFMAPPTMPGMYFPVIVIDRQITILTTTALYRLQQIHAESAPWLKNVP